MFYSTQRAIEGLVRKRLCISPFVKTDYSIIKERKNTLLRDCSWARKRKRNHKRNPLKRPQSNIAFIHLLYPSHLLVFYWRVIKVLIQIILSDGC